MKKLTIWASAALMVALAGSGCSGSGIDEVPGMPQNPEVPDVDGGIRILTVGMSQFQGPDSRASFGPEEAGKLAVVWDENDRIVAFETAGEHITGHAYRLTTAGGVSSGTFEYAGEQTPPASIAEIYYPESLAATDFAVPAEQTYTPGSFDPSANVMRATVSDPGAPIVFESLTSIACIRLTGNGERVTSIRADLTPVGGAKKSYTVTSSEGVVLSQTPVPFYIVVEGSASPCDAAFTISVDGKETMLQQTTAPKIFANGSVVRLPVLTYAKNLYQVLDYWPNDTAPEGIVFSVSNGGFNGKILSLDELGTGVVWGPTNVKQFDVAGDDIYNVASNSRTITRKIIEARCNDADFISAYPGFNWIYATKNQKNLDGFWYCPSLEELAELCVVMSGLSWSELKASWKYYDQVQMPGFNETVAARKAFKNLVDTAVGATILNINGSLYSTKETSAGGSVWCLRLDRDNTTQSCLMQPITKSDTFCRMRAVRAF